MNELKPCPFCGKRVKRVVGFGGLNLFKCRRCGAAVSFDNDYYNIHKNEAVNAWNRREYGDGMTDREKLAKMIGGAPVWKSATQGEACTQIADHLIAHGVRLEEKQATSDGWIPVEERLPEEDGSYLVCTDLGSVYTSHFYAEKHFASMCVYGYVREAQWSRRGKAKVTHWMPMPQPPKED